jgi:hypothetical protein
MAMTGGTRVGQLDPGYYANPNWLLNALPSAVGGLPDVVQTPGAITCTPKSAGRFQVTVGADDGFGGKVSKEFTLTVN